MLHVPVGSQSFCTKTPSWGTTRPNAANGVSITPAVGSKSSWVAVGSALAADAYGVLINVNSGYTSTVGRNCAVDLGADPAGGSSYGVVVANMLTGGAYQYDGHGGGVWFYFPIFLGAGSTLAMRAQGTNTSTIRVGYIVYQQPSNPSMFRKGSFTETIGVTEGAIVGVAITPGTTSEGAWTSIGTTTNRLWWWQPAVQVNASDGAWNTDALHVDIATGDATHKDIICTDYPILTNTQEGMGNVPLTLGVEWDVPAGATMYMRVQASASLDSYTAGLYGGGG